MKTSKFWLLALPLTLSACNATMPDIMQTGSTVASAAGYNNQAQLISGLKSLLELSSTRAAANLGQSGGYSNHSLYRIGLPANLQPIATSLRQFGFGSQVDKIEALMNRGAEQAAGEAQAVLVNAVRNMTVTDALGIVRGGNTAATDYFRQQTETTLRQRYLPIIQENLKQVGFYNQYQQLLTTYQQLPIGNKPNLDLEQHVLDHSLNALFKEVAVQEQLIRQDPIGRGSAAIGSILSSK